jgi:hypothetical protein
MARIIRKPTARIGRNATAKNQISRRRYYIVFANAAREDIEMKMFHRYVLVLNIAGALFLISCTNEPIQNQTYEQNAASTAAPPPQNFRNTQMGMGMGRRY